MNPSNAPTNIYIYPRTGLGGLEVHATFHAANSLPATYAQFQIATDNAFSNIVYDSGQVAIAPISDGNEGTMVFEWVPDTPNTYYYRLCFWDDDNHTQTTWQVWNGTTVSENSKSAVVRPTGDDSVELMVQGSSSHYANVDEATLNKSDCNYAHATVEDVSAGIDKYTIGSPRVPADAKSVDKVSFYAYWGGLSYYSNTDIAIQPKIGNSSGTLRTHHFADSNESYEKSVSQDFATNPDTGNAWTPGEVNSLKAGAYLSAHYSGNSGGYAYLYQLYLTVYWTEYEFDYTPTNENFVVGFPAISSLSYTHDKEMYTFTAEVQDTYTKPPIVSLSVDNNSYLMELKSRNTGRTLDGWSCKRPITIDNNSNSNALTDYQIRIDLDSSNFNFAKAKSDGADIRFTDSDGTTLLNYWIESWDSSGETAIIWVKVPSIPANSTKTIYMYYGNASATSESDGESTFEFFDDFDDGIIDAKWTTSDSNWVEQNGYILANTNDWITDELHAKNLSINLPFIIETKGLVHNTASDLRVSLIFSDDSTQNMHWVTSSPDKWSDFFGSKMDWAMSPDVWYNFIVKPVKNEEQKWYLDGTLKTPQTSVSLPSLIKEIKLRGKGYARWDFIRLRKYTDSEPSVSVGNEVYTYTYQHTLPLERGQHEYHVEVGNVWTVLIGDTNYLHTQYTLQEKPRIEVFAGNRKITISDPVLTENTIPDIDMLDFDTEEDLREGVGNLTVRFTANEIKEYTMHVTGIRKKTGGWHIKAEETAKEDLKQTINFSAQAISSLAIVQSILPDYTIHGGENLTETIYLQSFQNERISDVLQRILLINGAAATARNKHLYIYPQSGDSKAVLHATDPDTQYNADFRIVNKLREYYVKKQYPVPQSALTNYDASNWGGTASNELQTGNGVLPKNPYCLKGNGTIYRSVDFAFTDYDQFHIGFAPDSDNTLEIRLETDASNYRKYIRTFSGRKGAGFVLTASSADATVTKDITFSTKYIHLVQGRTSQACTVKIELKKSGAVVASSVWQTTGVDGFFGQYFDNVECDTITISFTNLYVVGSSYGVNCENLQIEEHKQVYETTGTHTFVTWQQKYIGAARVSVSKQYLYKGDSATVNGTITLGAVPALSGNQKYALNLHKCRMTVAYKPTADYTGVKYTSVPLNLTAHVENRVLKAEINGTIKNTRWYEIIIIAYKVDYNFTYLIQQTVTDGAWVWEYANYEWALSYNLFDYAVIPLSAFSTVGSPTNQVNTIRLIASGDTYYDEIYVTATNPTPKYVEAENEESIKNHWLAFEIRTTDGWSSKESAQAFAQAFVNKFGEPGESYEKNVSFWTDINIGDMVECDGKQMQVYCIVYNLLQGTKRIMVGRKITDTLEFLKQTSAKIQALEKNIM